MKRSDEFLAARQQLEARRSFFIHVAVFVVVCTALVVINLATAADYFWAKWPLMGWGIGLTMHGLRVFVMGDRLGITDEMVEREMIKNDSR